jgi:tetratricopeptide (TPR) repeat protein
VRPATIQIGTLDQFRGTEIMFSDDYILKIIRQATAVFAKIIGLKNAEQYREALQVIDQTLEQLIGLDVEIIRLLDDESLYTLLMKEDVLDLEKLGFIADLFKEEGDIHKLQGQIEESINCYIRSLNYSLIVGINSETSHPIELSQKIDELLQKLATYAFEEQTLLNLFSYYENRMEFAKADDMLSRLAAPNDSRAYVVDEMKSFYKRLLEKSPKELADGGMSQIQIQNKLKELE